MILSRAALAFALLAALSLSASAQPNPRAPEPAAKIEVRARPIAAFEPRNPERTRFGQLTFRGGIELTSSSPHFGGISAIRVEADGAKFLAVTDKGYWLRGRIVYEGSRPAGIADAEMAPVLGHDGKPLAARGWYDTEAMAARRRHRVARHRAREPHRAAQCRARRACAARAQPVPIPPGIASLPHNKGIECLEFVPRRPASCARADRDLGARSRRGRQHQGVSAGGVSLERVLGQAHRRFRPDRLRADAEGRSPGAGAQLLAVQGRGDAHPARGARGHSARRDRSTARC